MLLRCIDIESTGEDPDIGICEVGWCDLRQDNQQWEIVHPKEDGGICGRPYQTHVVNPGQPITPESSAIHHIRNEDVIGAMSPPDACALMLDRPTATTVLVAHNADSDKKVLGGDRGYHWIDTWKIAVTLAPNAPGYSLQTLCYWLDLELDRLWSLPSHRAGPDAYVCAGLLKRMLAKISFEEMIAISNGPVRLPRFSFGKHAKKPIAEVPSGYLEWMLREGGFDANIEHTCLKELERREKRERGAGE